jgi:hypothetical protein
MALDPDSAFVHVALKAAIKPECLADVPIDKLIRFRDGHDAELAAFRQHVASLADELREIRTVENIDVAHAHLESLQARSSAASLQRTENSRSPGRPRR